MAEASRMLALSEAGTRKQMKVLKKQYNSRFPQGLEWEILNAHAVVLLGMTHALRCVKGTVYRSVPARTKSQVNCTWATSNASMH